MERSFTISTCKCTEKCCLGKTPTYPDEVSLKTMLVGIVQGKIWGRRECNRENPEVPHGRISNERGPGAVGFEEQEETRPSQLRSYRISGGPHQTTKTPSPLGHVHSTRNLRSVFRAQITCMKQPQLTFAAFALRLHLSFACRNLSERRS